jgi:hypothetical protein
LGLISAIFGNSGDFGNVFLIRVHPRQFLVKGLIFSASQRLRGEILVFPISVIRVNQW